jgi:hypothetical protein
VISLHLYLHVARQDDHVDAVFRQRRLDRRLLRRFPALRLQSAQ